MTHRLERPVLVAQDQRTDHIAVQLLERQHKEGEIHRLDGRIQQNQKDAGDGAQEGAEEGDHIGDAHDHRDQRRVGELEEAAADKAEDPDDEGVQQLAPDKAGEDAVHLVDAPQDPGHRALGKRPKITFRA